MKLCYVDETGTDGESPLVVFVGVIADVKRVHRTRTEFEELFEKLTDLPEKSISEVKGSNLYYGRGRWAGVDGEARHAVIDELCNWLSDRKHSLALAAIDTKEFASSELKATTGLDIWMCGALHVSLQVQKAHQSIKKKKGATFLVFDEHKMKSDALAELLFDPPAWTDDYYEKTRKQLPLDQIMDTAFYARSHHVGLVQVADVFAFVLRRYSEIGDYGENEGYEGEMDRLSRWVGVIETCLLARSHRWPKRTKSQLAKMYSRVAPASLNELA